MNKILLLILAALSLSACNLFSSMDKPTTGGQIVDKALALMDDKKCLDAVKLFQGRTDLDDDAYHTLGWAQMCANGATLTSVAKTMFSYSKTGDNLTILGKLSNSMVPADQNKVDGFTSAIASFNKISNVNIRSVNLTMANLTKVASIVAKQAANAGSSGTVSRVDISDNCASGCTNCTNTTTGISDPDATTVGTTVLSATQSIVSGMGSVGDLAARLQALFPGGAAQAYRCTIFSKFFDGTETN